MTRLDRLEKIWKNFSSSDQIYANDIRWVLEELSKAFETLDVQMTVIKEIAKPLSAHQYDFRPSKYAEEWITELNKRYYEVPTDE